MPRKKSTQPSTPPNHQRVTKDDEEEMSRDLTNYVAVLQAAEMLGVGRVQASYLVRKKKLRGIKMGRGWLVYIPSIDKYLETKSKRGRPASRAPQAQKTNTTGQG